ncbi:hypothetical protein BDK51DRAFT_33161 [Blyttiomyces helicus]|uniref:Uncharacterized protein n=1 Tax=Blyttiomyces helicus TaxID=388810 RepID=A0A4P9WS46_9FUNG|nr:hypothetical protein BDK51DRAFT_33161 [Blyttiomyces helicus]|eukprot:RKO94120.1 hypothetical protein BDK51DRAFT_33161 [Blyttiomyces helicus]
MTFWLSPHFTGAICVGDFCAYLGWNMVASQSESTAPTPSSAPDSSGCAVVCLSFFSWAAGSTQPIEWNQNVSQPDTLVTIGLWSAANSTQALPNEACQTLVGTDQAAISVAVNNTGTASIPFPAEMPPGSYIVVVNADMDCVTSDGFVTVVTAPSTTLPMLGSSSLPSGDVPIPSKRPATSNGLGISPVVIASIVAGSMILLALIVATAWVLTRQLHQRGEWIRLRGNHDDGAAPVDIASPTLTMEHGRLRPPLLRGIGAGGTSALSRIDKLSFEILTALACEEDVAAQEEITRRFALASASLEQAVSASVSTPPPARAAKRASGGRWRAAESAGTRSSTASLMSSGRHYSESGSISTGRVSLSSAPGTMLSSLRRGDGEHLSALTGDDAKIIAAAFFHELKNPTSIWERLEAITSPSETTSIRAHSITNSWRSGASADFEYQGSTAPGEGSRRESDGPIARNVTTRQRGM